MSSFKIAIMTDAGVKLMVDSIIEGYKIEFVKMVIGSGEYEEEEKTAEALRIRTELKQKRQEVGFSSRLISDENEVLLKTLITNKELDVGYRMREIGIIAKKAGAAEEVLYSIAVAKEADYLPPKDNPVEIIQEYYTKVSNVENIVINVEMEAYALAEDMQKVLYPEYDEAEELSELESGRNIFKEFGKLKKAVSDLIGHIRDKVIHITSDERKLWNTVSDKVDKIEGKGLSANDYTTKEKDKLGGIEEGANNYVHPNTHPANIIVQDSTHRFVTDGEKDTWNETLDNAKDYSDSAYRQATGYTDQKIADLIGGAPETLDTLKEVADAIQANKEVSTALDAAIGKKADKTALDTHTADSTIHITSAERTNWNDANTKKHTHSNKGVLDKITQTLLDSWNAAYSHISDAVKHITAAERTLWNTVGNKVDKVSGKGLSTNDYTTADKKKLDGISEGANKIIVDSALSSTSTNPIQNKIVKSALDGKAASSHTHNYAGSSSAGGSANSAVKLDSSAGSTVQPVYFKDGKPTACTYSLNASVPSGAKFTDTTYSNMTGATASAAGKAGLVPAPAVGKQTSFLRGDGTWATPTDTNTWRGITDSLTSTSTTTSLSAKAGKSLKDDVDTINNNLKQTTAGKFVLPNGLKICWGIYTPPNANGYVRQGKVTFPITFTSAPYVFCTKVTGNAAVECVATVGCSNQTTTSVVIKAMAGNAGEVLADREIPINWIAIGY